MSDVAGVDLDGSTARAWRSFQARLADYLAEMTDQDSLVIDIEVPESDVDGAAPYVQFAGFGETMIRAEVSGNRYLAERYELDEDQCQRITALGWSEPVDDVEDAGNFSMHVSRAEADRLAVMSVRVLREVFAVAHPAFVIADGLVDAPAPEEIPLAVDSDEALATMPESHEHLCELVDATLAGVFGSPPEKDDDGDIPVWWGSCLVFVRVPVGVPVVELFSLVAVDVAHRKRAAFEVNVLNRDLRFIKFVLVQDRVFAHVHLPAAPFVPEQLRSMLTEMTRRLDEIDDDLLARVGGRRLFEADASEADGA